MATTCRSRAVDRGAISNIAKPSGSLHPRVQKVGPEHFGIVAVDCAKARSKWMLADFYGSILIPPTVLEHNSRASTRRSPRSACAMEPTPGRFARRHRADRQLPPADPTGVFITAGFDTRIVHPLTTKQYRLPADPGNKTDDTDLAAIHRATINGFGLIEPPLDEIMGQLRLLAATGAIWSARTPHCAIRSKRLDVILPGYAGLLRRRLQQPGGTLPSPAVCSRPRRFARWAATDWPRSSRSRSPLSTTHPGEDPGLGQWDDSPQSIARCTTHLCTSG